MHIILRSSRNVFGALWAPNDGPSHPTFGRPTSFIGALSSPFMVGLVGLLLVAFLAIWAFLHPHSAGHSGAFALAMAAPILELRQKRSTLSAKANGELEVAQKKAKAEGRALTAEEIAAQDTFDVELKALDDEIALEQRKLDRERGNVGATAPARTTQQPAAGTTITNMVLRSEADRARGFRSHRDFLLAAMANAGFRERGDVEDERLRPLAVTDKSDRSATDLAFMLPEAFTPRSLLAAAGTDEQGGFQDQYGGYAAATQRLPGMLSVGFEGDPTAGRTQPVPMSSPSVEIMARTDKNHTTSVSGGFTVSRKAEAAPGQSSRVSLEMIKLAAATLFGLSYGTEEILQDSPVSFAAIIDSGFRDQFPAAILNEKIRGKGANEFLGVLNSPAKVTVPKAAGQAANTIVAQNILDMASRIWGAGNAVWMANHDTKPQLASLYIPIGTTAGIPLYDPADQPGFPDMLWGMPVFYTEFCESLTNEGDLMLINWSQYLEGLYQPLQSAESVHVRFINHERAFKFWLRNAGAPWWSAPLTPNKSAKTLSPIITLQAR